jgi:hypothetical protein
VGSIGIVTQSWVVAWGVFGWLGALQKNLEEKDKKNVYIGGGGGGVEENLLICI